MAITGHEQFCVSVTHIIHSSKLGPFNFCPFFFNQSIELSEFGDTDNGVIHLLRGEMESGVSPEHQDMFCSITRFPWALICLSLYLS